MDAKQKIIEAVQKKHPQLSTKEIEKSILLKVLGKREIYKVLQQSIDKRFASPISRLAGGILVSDINDVISEFPRLSKSQIEQFFKTETLADPNVQVNGACITRPMLISMIEALEDYTGRRLLDATQAPFRWLDDIDDTLTVSDLAEFFSWYEPTKIWFLRKRKYRQLQAPQSSAKTQNIQRAVVKSYLEDCCGNLKEITHKEEIDETKPITSLQTRFLTGKVAGNQEAYFVIVEWMENRFQKYLDAKFIRTKTIGEMIDFFAAE